MTLRHQAPALVFTFFSLFSVSCGENNQRSAIKVSDVRHTPVKRQSIGNCWLYATSTWAESLHLAATGNTVNLSESYWTYWDWFRKIVGSSGSTIETGGSWRLASNIIRNHGYMLEGDFLPAEAEAQMSDVQRSAEIQINESLKSGDLKDPSQRTPENVKVALNKAFGVDIDSLNSKIKPAHELQTGKLVHDEPLTLADEIAGGRHAWSNEFYPQLFGENAREPRLIKRRRANLLLRVLRAVNDRSPVIMSSMVEFAALNTEKNSTFEYDLYLKKGYSEGQGGHLIVLEDYVVNNVPGVGRIGEGDVSNDLKEKALDGTVEYLVVKNSWGTDRAERGITDGYTRFEMKYLDQPLPFDLNHGDSDLKNGIWYSALSNFILPPEY
jgi:hypothetical protein